MINLKNPVNLLDYLYFFSARAEMSHGREALLKVIIQMTGLL